MEILNRRDLRDAYDHYFPEWWRATYWVPEKNWRKRADRVFVTEIETSDGIITVTYDDFFGCQL